MSDTSAPAAVTGPIGRHLLPDSAETAGDHRLRLGGLDVGVLIEEFGTPLFIYDEATLRARCREALSAFGPGVAYATKAFLCKAMATLALEEGLNLDVSTMGELEVALAAGASPVRLVLHGNNKSDDELGRAIALRFGRIVVDSFDEIDRLSRLADPASAQSVLVRVNPGVEAHTHDYIATGRVDSKFGFSLAAGDAERAIRMLDKIPGVDVVGVHAHIGSQIFRLDSYERLLEAVAPTIGDFRELCIGGGVGVAYLSDEAAPSITEWAYLVHSVIRRLGISSDVTVTAEPGRAVVATAGMTGYRIGTIKHIDGVRTYVAVDGGMSDNPRPVLYGSGYEAFLPREVDAPRPFAARIVGKHCESGDVVVNDARLPADVQTGDILVTPVTGAYGFAMASNYNRVGRPAVVFVRDGGARLVVRRETTEDLLRLEA